MIPGAIDFVKKKWLTPEQDSPEATMSTLATTKPEVLPQYMTAMAGWLDAQVKFFNRDVTGTPSQWVVDLRAAIRPIATIGAGAMLGIMVFASISEYKVDPTMAASLAGVRLSCEAIVSSWFGSRISIHK
uniref:Uncharacterized protein n=1 Tax=viral metagenome TaxID=1070528 RepID=A0A6H1Z6V2_9ZZZZ